MPPQKVFHKKGALKNFPILTGKHLPWTLFFNKVADLQVYNFIKKKFLGTPILKNICVQLLLD